ncbi:hypothetical protein ACE6H2_020334 [Prunus campanulata]
MAGSGMSELRAPIFNGSNYDFWRIKMCTIFKSHRLWEIVEQGFETPVKKEGNDALSAAQKLTLEENIAKDAKALGLIQNSVSDDIFPRIALQETAKDAWAILQNEFRGDKKWGANHALQEMIIEANQLIVAAKKNYKMKNVVTAQ